VQHGRGTFVLAPASPQVEESIKHETLNLLARELTAQAREMGFSLEDTIEALRRMWKE